uniref:Putative secreted peptide n=1 Tax=Anopheles braziliensis TaxID=58242 RepID=A0A2M3ZW94_9DIPT
MLSLYSALHCSRRARPRILLCLLCLPSSQQVDRGAFLSWGRVLFRIWLQTFTNQTTALACARLLEEKKRGP